MNNNIRRKKEMALVIAAVSLALSIILLGGTGAFAETLTTLHDFGANQDGQNPQAGVVFDQQGNLYGTTIGRHERKRHCLQLDSAGGRRRAVD